MEPFERYTSLIDDFSAFKAALDCSLPVTLWANPERITPGELEKILIEAGFSPRKIKWCSGAYKLPEYQRAGKRWEFFSGLFHIQEEAAMVPAKVLAPCPGECVLDMCAAPGNKTAQMAFMMKQTGTIIANDINSKRLGALRQTCERLGVRNTTFFNYNAANIPGDAGTFDKILVDAPCSCEGTTRKNLNAGRSAEVAYSRKQKGAQKAILFKAAQLCRKGGKILYATCTYAPEENENVVDDVIKEYGENCLQLRQIKIAGLTTSPGITEWEGHKFSQELTKTVRIWPHQNDTGGFFMALLEKKGERKTSAGLAKSGENTDAENMIEKPAQSNHHRLLSAVRERYALPEGFFENMITLKSNQDQLHLVDNEHAVPMFFRKGVTGLRFLHLDSGDLKLTHPGALLCAQHARLNTVELNTDQLDQFLRRRIVLLNPQNLLGCKHEGYVLVRHAGYGVGSGVLGIAATGDKTLKSQFPKTWSKRLYEESKKVLC